MTDIIPILLNLAQRDKRVGKRHHNFTARTPPHGHGDVPTTWIRVAGRACQDGAERVAEEVTTCCG